MIQRTILALAFASIATIGSAVAARADDTVSVSSGQKGAWDQMIVQQGIDQGFFKKEHLDIKLSYTSGGPDTIQAVATGGADVGMGVGTTAVIAAFTKGAPVKIGAASFTGQNDVFLYTKAESSIKSFADMNGKSVGFSRPGSSTFIFEHVLAAQDKVQPNFVSAGDMAANLTQVMSGQLDAGWAVPPFNLDLISQKKLRIIARGKDAREIANQTVRVDIVNTNFARDHRDVDVRFWRAYRTTLDWMYKNTNASIAAFAKYNDIPINVARDAFAFYPKSAVQAYPVAEFNKSVEDAITYKFITKPLDADQSKAIFDIVFDHR